MPKVLPSAPTPGGGRLTRGRRVSTTLAEINVIPLVDVMLVLLIIFMVAAPMLQRGVEVNLPVASRSTEIASDRIFVNVPITFKEDRRVYIGQDPVRVDVLTERMRQMMVNRTDKQVFLRGDGGIELQELLDIMDRLKAAGVEKVASSRSCRVSNDRRHGHRHHRRARAGYLSGSARRFRGRSRRTWRCLPS
jgi:biopolymer transport protein ExbD